MRVAGLVLTGTFVLGIMNATFGYLTHWDLIPALMQLLACGVGMRVGLGLHQRQRQAFWGWCFFALLSTSVTVLFVGAHVSTSGGMNFRLDGPAVGLMLVQWLGCYVIPIALTIRRWRSIRWR
jgi:hypothetical protein